MELRSHCSLQQLKLSCHETERRERREKEEEGVARCMHVHLWRTHTQMYGLSRHVQSAVNSAMIVRTQHKDAPLPHSTFLCVGPTPLLKQLLAGPVQGLKEPGEGEEGGREVEELADQCRIQGVVHLVLAVIKHCFA